MHDGSQGNAMTEIALALAMGFFSLLVPTMVSMGGSPWAVSMGGLHGRWTRRRRPGRGDSPQGGSRRGRQRPIGAASYGILGTDRAVLEGSLSRGAARPHGRGPAPARC